MPQKELIPHLFRTESGKITAVLCKWLGVENIGMAEDITSETFLAALETWPYKGVPDHPAAWLYTVAKNKARNYFIRHQVFTGKVAPQLRHLPAAEVEIDLSDENITDSQLQMLFAICHPSIPVEAQIGLALRILCGFGIEEIANAFLTSKETINKRLFRAKEKLRLQKINLCLPGAGEINSRLETVLTTLYLLYNEGYYSESQDTQLREDLCLEAMRLTYLLTENQPTAQPNVYALLALMCFHASRFAARKSNNGEMILYHDQDEALWNDELIAKGAYFLHQASQGEKLSKYHIEAAIAYWHTIKADTRGKWQTILQLYDHLLQMAYSPIAALNRTYALSKVAGNRAAIREAEKLPLTGNPYYHTLLGTLYSNLDKGAARKHLEQAHALARTQVERQVIQKQMENL